ncbi:DUF5689 domain-containing protein [Gramella sp. GC03-9]|uniref:DUF5689 domain-containing protein n=1 Tax=Christiangramia oceanisediminis TaxID=2920386 RepID=A0A9X2KW42_9FLAO|nr:DUF5689 domain-containing protein [Gramella oceanisediminis]MCP9199440.1 DUF5689 domain-containing protein [Gramella oceanisediminis]
MKDKIFIAGILMIVFVFTGCVQTDDFDLPEMRPVEIDFDGELTSIEAVKGNFNIQTGQVFTFINTDAWFTGYVISSDAGGNFYKELIIQDKASNPVAGIQLLLDDNSLFETFNFGRKIYVKLDGLSLGYNNGVLQLGMKQHGDVIALPNSLIDDHVIRTEEVAEITPLSIKISDLNPNLKNLYVKIEDLQFDRNLVKQDRTFSFASNPADQYDGLRQLESCETGETILLSTSTFSNFRSLLLPQGSGSVEGILTRDFFDERYVVMLNTPDKLDMNGPRCDPEFFECDTDVIEGSQILYDENFEGVTSNSTLNSRDWTNENLSGGETKFKPTLVNGNRVLRISAYNTLESPLEAWLVTPEIKLSETENERLSFDIRSSYDNGLLLKVFISQDFSGDIRTATWIPVDAEIPLGPSNRNSTIFTTSRINLSCLEGKVWVGFQYLGSAPDKTTTYDLDNFRLTGD